jgi:glycosyltransferase involved in cell wall biosynthesis
MAAAGAAHAVIDAPPMTAAPGERFSICLVAHMAYGAITGGARGHAGGVEHQTTMTARWLARRGHEVSLIVWNEGQPEEMRIDGVRVISLCRQDDGLRGVRFLHPRWTSLLRALRRADADVYYQNCGEYVTGQVAMWCRRKRRPFVYSVASDPECDPALPMLAHARERVLFRFGIRHAARLIVQTRKQQRMMKDGFSRDAAVLPMPCPGPSDAEYVAPRPAPNGSARAVWVGRISPEKQLGVLIEIAAALPHVRFDIAGGAKPGDAGAEAVLARARALPNVRVLGRVARDEMPAVYRGASALICTSSYEGFPNTFLEAWSHGVPVVSTVDPDDLIQERGLGLVAQSPRGLIAHLASLLDSPEQWTRFSSNARAFYITHHRMDEALVRFEQLFAEAARAGRGQRSRAA